MLQVIQISVFLSLPLHFSFLPRPKNSLTHFQLPKVSSIIQDPRSPYPRCPLGPVRMKVRRLIVVAQVNLLRPVAFRERPLVIAAIHRQHMILITVIVVSHQSFAIGHFSR
jgi:hypothetical protein